MNKMKQQNRRKGRPALMEANAAALFAAMGMACITALRLFLPAQWSAAEAAVVWDALQGLLYIGLAARMTHTVRPSAREKRLRLNPPTIAQGMLTLLAICAGVLFTDDLTLLTGAFLQRLGLNVSRHVAAGQYAPTYLYVLRVLASGVLPAFSAGWLWHGTMLSAWERRGTCYAVLTVAALGALLSGSVVTLPAAFMLLLAAGCIAARTGSLLLSVSMHMGVLVAGIAARQIQSAIGVQAARFGRLWRELGGKQGAGLLALETVLLGLAFLFLIRAVCSARPHEPAPWKNRPARIVQMDAAEVFVLAAAVVTALAVLFIDFLRMAGML